MPTVVIVYIPAGRGNYVIISHDWTACQGPCRLVHDTTSIPALDQNGAEVFNCMSIRLPLRFPIVSLLI